MYIILLKFTPNRHLATKHLPGHKAWLARGFEDGLFLMAGMLGSNLGGAILTRSACSVELLERVNDDPFVAENIVEAEVLDFSPAFASKDLQFLLEKGNGE
jgi:uncharacterized protein YciI